MMEAVVFFVREYNEKDVVVREVRSRNVEVVRKRRRMWIDKGLADGHNVYLGHYLNAARTQESLNKGKIMD